MLQLNLHELCKKQGVSFKVDRSPKCHPEIAGESVENTFAFSKGYIRQIPWETRKSVQTFKSMVADSLARDRGAFLTVSRTQKFARRQRDYILAYYFYHVKRHSEDEDIYCPLPQHQIESLRQLVKTH